MQSSSLYGQSKIQWAHFCSQDLLLSSNGIRHQLSFPTVTLSFSVSYCFLQVLRVLLFRRRPVYTHSGFCSSKDREDYDQYLPDDVSFSCNFQLTPSVLTLPFSSPCTYSVRSHEIFKACVADPGSVTNTREGQPLWKGTCQALAIRRDWYTVICSK